MQVMIDERDSIEFISPDRSNIEESEADMFAARAAFRFV